MKPVFRLMLLLSLALGACAPVVHGNPGAGGGSVTRALTSEPTSLDPQGVASSGQNVILPYLFDTLVYRDTDNTYKPFLAESWQTAADGKSVTFKLRSGVTFSDGTPFNAEAVVFTFERFKKVGAKSPIAQGIQAISKVEAVDASSVRFSFDKPNATFFGTVSMPYAGILSPAAVEKEGEAFGQKPVGSGPFVLSEWQPGVSITLTRNNQYRWAPPAVKNQAAPKLEKAIFRVVPDAAAQLSALQAGEVDVVFVNQPEQIETLKKDSGVQLIDTTLNSLVYLGFNCQKAPFDDVRVRQALAHAVNKDELVQTALGGIGSVAFAPLAPTLPGFDPSLKSAELGYDPQQTGALLAEAGFTKGADGIWSRDGKALKVLLLTSTRAPNGALATMLQSQLKAAGVGVEIQQLDSTAAMDASSKGQYDLLLWRYDWNDADVLNIYLGSKSIGRTNRTFYANPQVDALLGKAGVEMDAAARNKLYLEAQQLIMNDAPWQPLYVPKDIIAMRKTVQGVVFGPMGRLLLNDATVN